MPKIRVESDVPLAPLTTLGVGGKAKYFASVKSVEELKDALNFAKERSLPVFVVGEGSNVIINDSGFPGVVVKVEIGDISFGKFGEVKVGAGVSWDKFVEEAVYRNLSGLECLSAIPGTVGSAPIQNIGAYGTEVSSVIKALHAIDRETLEEVVINKKECDFSYRKSIFNSSKKNRYIITEVIFKLWPDGKPNISYQDLLNYFDGKNPTLREVREAVISIRTKKGHVAPPMGPRSAGSFFKNPILSEENFKILKEKVKNIESKWFWKNNDGEIKVSAARLVEEAGFLKGVRFGNVGTSPFHTLVLITYDGATSVELMSLAERIRTKIKSRFDITLDIEPELIGFKKHSLP